ARCALVAVALGRLEDAERAVHRALVTGPPLGHYEAGWAQVELAAARGTDDCAALAAAAWHRAGAGGHLASVPRLAALAGRPCRRRQEWHMHRPAAAGSAAGRC